MELIFSIESFPENCSNEFLRIRYEFLRIFDNWLGFF